MQSSRLPRRRYSSRAFAAKAQLGLRFSYVLRQVVAKGGKQHPIQSMGRVAYSRGRRSRPRVAAYVGELWSPLEASLGAVVETVPEPHRAFDQRARITRAA